MYTQANTLLLKQTEFNSNQHSIHFLKAMKLSSTSTSAQYVFPIKSIWTKWNIFIIDNTVLLKNKFTETEFPFELIDKNSNQLYN